MRASMSKIGRASVLMLASCIVTGCEKEQALTREGDVNLAGCESPAGLTQDEAGKVACTQEDPAAAPVTPVVTAPGNTPDSEVILAAIAGQAQQDGGSEYGEARKTVEGDFTGDSSPDIAVLYTLEGAGGGNGSVTYLAAFVRGAGQLRLADTATVSGLGSSVQDISLSGGTVHLKILLQGPDDPDCCPTVEEKETYVFHGGKWMQVLGQP